MKMAAPARRPKIVTLNKDRNEEHIKVSSNGLDHVHEVRGPVIFAEFVERRVCDLVHDDSGTKEERKP